jgi:hypothetical protein
VTIDNTDRYLSGGTTISPVNVNSGSSNASIAQVVFGAITTSAVSNKRNVYRSVLKAQASPNWVVGDQVIVNFGAQESSSGEASGTTARVFARSSSPIVIAPQHCALIHVWNVGNAVAAPNWEFDLGMWER